MATSENTEAQMCLMCLEAPAITEEGAYQHAYCEPCLKKHRETQQQESVVVCPDCQKVSATADGLDTESGTKTGDGIVDKVDVEGMIGPVTSTLGDKEVVAGAIENECKICRFKGKTEEAVNLCTECSDLHICEACTLVHGRNKLTQYHILIPIASTSKQKNTSCVAHGEPVRGKCSDCSQFVCHVCTLLEHEDHNIKSLAEVFRERVEEVNNAVANEEKRHQGLRSDEAGLTKCKNTAEEIAAGVIKIIEDHAETCIEQILKCKEQLKTQVKSEFHVVELLSKQLDGLALMAKESEEVIANAKAVVSKAELSPQFLEILEQAGIKQKMEMLKIGDSEYTRNRETNLSVYEELMKTSPTFYAKGLEPEIGWFRKPDPDKLRRICQENGYCTCEKCGERITKPDLTRKEECHRRGFCKCEICGSSLREPDSSRKIECNSRGCCKCEACGCTFSEPNIRRKKECNEKTLCECKRCGRKFDLDELTKRKGKCKDCDNPIGWQWGHHY